MPEDRNPFGDVKSGSTSQKPKRTGAIIAAVIVVIVVVAAILIVPRFMGGSATTTAPTEQTQAAQTAGDLANPVQIVLLVDSDEHGDGVLFDDTVYIEEGGTVEDALDASGLQISKRSAIGASAYISGINGIMEKEQKGTSGWVYYVNGEKARRSCDQVTLEEGDVVAWYWKLDGTTLD